MLVTSHSRTLRVRLKRKFFRQLPVLAGLLLVICLSWVAFSLLKRQLKQEKNETKPLKESSIARSLSPPTSEALEPLIWIEELDKLRRPNVFYPLPSVNRADHSFLAKQALDSALSLKQAGITFRVIIFAWKRRASLKRLMDSLLGANYHDFIVHLDFHMDGGAHPRVIQYIDELDWPYGRIRVNRHTQRVGLERTIMESWQPISDNEYAFFFEDDIAVSRHYFEYVLVCLSKYILPGGRRPAPSVWNERLVGISLNTPRYNEVAIPGYDWVPQKVIGDDETQFLFQLPCSWGALYFPWIWRDFLEYYKWRRVYADEEELHPSIPDSATMYWRRSWKKYLIEFMYMQGQFMLYPSLPKQLSFSTHHREPGEHTDAKPQEHLVDELGILVLDYFTVPLVKSSDINNFEKLLAEMKPLRELLVVSFHHELVPNVYSLAQLGAGTVSLMQKYGWNNGKYATFPGCILDRVTFPVLDDGSKGERFLLFETQLSLGHQLNALKNAAAYARILNRTLIVPPIVAPKNASIQVPINQIIRLNLASHQEQEFVKMIPLNLFSETYHGWIDRIVQLVPWLQRKTEMMVDMQDDLLTQNSLIPASQVLLHFFSGKEKDISQNYGNCKDRVLTFRHLFGSFEGFGKADLQLEYQKWVSERFTLKDSIVSLRGKVERGIGGPLACVVYSRGDDPNNCGKDAQRKKNPSELDKLIAYRSCKPMADRTIQYVVEDAATLELNLTSIYILNQGLELPERLAAQVQEKHSVKLYSKQDINFHINQAGGELSDLPAEILEEIRDMLEIDLCVGATFFLGNVYSTISQRILYARGPEKISSTLGEAVSRRPKPINLEGSSSPLANSSLINTRQSSKKLYESESSIKAKPLEGKTFVATLSSVTSTSNLNSVTTSLTSVTTNLSSVIANLSSVTRPLSVKGSISLISLVTAAANNYFSSSIKISNIESFPSSSVLEIPTNTERSS